jgi:uncharacterized protein YndB with AHSA1/START domain
MKADVKINGTELQITRSFAAPRAEVFAWWSEAEKLQQWSGCKDAIACEVEMDFRVGGGFKQKMTLDGKGTFTFTGKYDEIIVPERIAYHADFGMAVSRVLIEFFEENGGTKMVLTQSGLPDAAMCQIISQGTTESFAKLDALLGVRSPAGQATGANS